MSNKGNQHKYHNPARQNNSENKTKDNKIPQSIALRTNTPHVVEQELTTLPEYMSSHSGVSGVRVPRSLVFCVMLCRSLLALLSFFFWPLYCMSFFHLRVLIGPFVSSNAFC